LAQDLFGWINLKPPCGLAANVGNAAVSDNLIWYSFGMNSLQIYGAQFLNFAYFVKRYSFFQEKVKLLTVNNK